MNTMQMNTTTRPAHATPAKNHHNDFAASLCLRKEIAVLEERIATLEHELHTVYHSRSWQITRPLRLLVYVVSATTWKVLARTYSKKLLYTTIAILEKHPQLKSLIIGAIKKMGLRDSVVGLVQIPSVSINNPRDDLVYRPKDRQALSNEGLVIYQKLKNTFSNIPHE